MILSLRRGGMSYATVCLSLLLTSAAMSRPWVMQRISVNKHTSCGWTHWWIYIYIYMYSWAPINKSNRFCYSIRNLPWVKMDHLFLLHRRHGPHGAQMGQWDPMWAQAAGGGGGGQRAEAQKHTWETTKWGPTINVWDGWIQGFLHGWLGCTNSVWYHLYVTVVAVHKLNPLSTRVFTQILTYKCTTKVNTQTNNPDLFE